MAVWTTTQRLGYSLYSDPEIVTMRLSRDLKPLWNEAVYVNNDAAVDDRPDMYGWIYAGQGEKLMANWVRVVPIPNYGPFEDSSSFYSESNDNGLSWSDPVRVILWSGYDNIRPTRSEVIGETWWMPQNHYRRTFSYPWLYHQTDSVGEWSFNQWTDLIGLDSQLRFADAAALVSDSHSALLAAIWVRQASIPYDDYRNYRVTSEDGGATWTPGDWPLPDGVEVEPADDTRVAYSGGSWFAAFGVQTDDGPKVLMGESGDLSFASAAWT